MQNQVIIKILGVLCLIFSVTMLPPVIVSWFFQDGEYISFLIAFAAIGVTGLIMWLPNVRVHRDLRYRDGFVVVVLFWVVLGLFGSIPLYLINQEPMSITDAVFESISGLTTTGATVITAIDDMPPSVLYYRQQLQWLGGMGIIVLAVAIMPMLGVGGMQLYRAETPGPMKDTKLTPRITETAKALWYIYLGLTVACALGYRLAGMSTFDAVGHSFSTVAIGGFSTHDTNLGYFDNPAVHSIAIVFMLVAGMNFTLHFTAWRSRSLRSYFGDSEVLVYLALIFVVCAVVVGALSTYDVFSSTLQGLQQGVFQVVSIATTTGFTTGGYAWWPSFLPVLLLASSFVGGCAGSTGGGMKVIRVLLLYKQGRREFLRLVHPNAVMSIKINSKPVPDAVIQAVWAFFPLYVLCFTGLGILMTATGLDWTTAFASVAACLNNLGPGIGGVAATYSDVTETGKWILCFAMLLGRLELMTLLVLFSVVFWRS
ncbi:MAG: Trk system potassium uptake protein TrkH [Gammaproteobacteria bacterium]|nr:Trk system potassium uptake protein TrkH [Gammaproteobacteria bacterium]